MLKIEDKNLQGNGSLTKEMLGTQTQNDTPQRMQWTKDHVTKVCESLGQKHVVPSGNESLTLINNLRFTLTDKFKLIGCKVPKVGSTNMGRLMYTLEHLSNTNDANKISTGKSRNWRASPSNISSVAELRVKLETYTKYMFVREPFERLVSAYRDKRPRGLFRKTELSFREFLEKIISSPTHRLNKHHQLMTYRCKPCSIHYDFIGQLARYNEDISVILESVGAGNKVILPQREKTGYQGEKSSDVVFKYKQMIPNVILKQIYEKYYLDYYLFGFPKPFQK